MVMSGELKHLIEVGDVLVLFKYGYSPGVRTNLLMTLLVLT